MSDITEFMLNKLDKLDEKMDLHREEHQKDMHVIESELQNQSRLLADYNESLREHMRRTSLLEERVAPIEQDFMERKVINKMKNNKWKKIGMILGIVGTLVGILTGIAGLFGMI